MYFVACRIQYASNVISVTHSLIGHKYRRQEGSSGVNWNAALP